jgi:hypothetical protein
MELNRQFYASAILTWKKYLLVYTSRNFSVGVKTNPYPVWPTGELLLHCVKFMRVTREKPVSGVQRCH